MLSYHDLHITTKDLPRTSIFNLPFSLHVTCTRSAGWELWERYRGEDKLLASEYPSAGGESWLRLDVAGHVIVDSELKQSVRN